MLDDRTLYLGRRLPKISNLVVDVGVVGREVVRWRLIVQSNLGRRSRIGVGVPHHLLRAMGFDLRRD